MLSDQIIEYSYDAIDNITAVRTRLNAGSSLADIATGISRQPMSNLIKSFDYGNGLTRWLTHRADYTPVLNQLYDGSATVVARSYSYVDKINQNYLWDNINSANNQSFWYTANNRLQNASGPWGDLTYYYDGVGNRTYKILESGGVTTTKVAGYPAFSNRVVGVTTNGTQTRTIGYDNAGNVTSDLRGSDNYSYIYNKANRLVEVKLGGASQATYSYNAQNQLILRDASGAATSGDPATSGPVHYVYDLDGNLIAEIGGTTGQTLREYIWLPQTSLGNNLPLAVIADVDTTPATYYVVADHLNRPTEMFDQIKSQVWQAVWLPYGAPHSITGSLTQNLRFPGQFFQIESNLHYNWHRHYDPSLGRYTQGDPLGFIDGPSVYAYARNNPVMNTDRDGLFSQASLFFSLDRPTPKEVERNNAASLQCLCEQAGIGDFAPYAGLAGAGALFGSSSKKPRTGVAGGGRSANRTSPFSRAIGRVEDKRIKGNLRRFGRKVAKGLPLVSVGLLFKDILAHNDCVARKLKGK